VTIAGYPRVRDGQVGRGTGPAEQGELIIFALGPDDVRQRVAPLFGALGQRTLWVGPVGAGSRLKLVNNTWLAFTCESVATSVALAHRLGLQTQTVVEALVGGPLVSPWQEAKLPRVATGEYSPQFPLSLALKDVQLAGEWQRAVDDGLGDQDLTVITRWLEPPEARR